MNPSLCTPSLGCRDLSDVGVHQSENTQCHRNGDNAQHNRGLKI